MKRINNKFKIILVIIVSIIIFSGISGYAVYNYFAYEVKYEKEDGTETSIEDALNELYSKKDNIICKMGENNKNSGIETIQIEHDNEKAIIVTG